jgi:uncharacterized membrane protein YdbT with pleckstrin-like domain
MMVWVASRSLGGHMFFPYRLAITENEVVLSRRGMFRYFERGIPLHRIASVTASVGLVVGTIVIESVGGGDDIVAKGFTRQSIEAIRAELAKYE